MNKSHPDEGHSGKSTPLLPKPQSAHLPLYSQITRSHYKLAGNYKPNQPDKKADISHTLHVSLTICDMTALCTSTSVCRKMQMRLNS